MIPQKAAQPRRGPEPQIRWQGKSLPISAACALAIQEHRRGHLPAVVELYALVLDKVPDYAEGHNNRGVVLQQMKRYDEALAAYCQAIALKPAYANAYFNRGTILKKLLRREEALASYDQAIALQPGHAEAHNNRGVLLQELKRYDEALASYDRVLALNPNHVEANNNRGVVLASKGNMAEAEKMFLKASALRPDFADPWFNLANIRSYQTADHADVQSIRALLNKPGISAEETEHLHFTLGKIYDDCGRYDEAFEHFRQANELRNAQVAYDARLVGTMTDSLIAVFSREFLEVRRPFASASRSPIFVVGMPRSGTTLLASILSNHPAVASAGELSTLGDLALGLSAYAGVPFPAAARQLTAAAAESVTLNYEKRLRRDVAAAVPHVVDKNPLNFRHLGFIAQLFPNARILHCTRHPLATGLSNYFQRFPLHMDYSFDLRNIGHFQREYRRLMAHWQTVPGLKLMDVAYEDLILHTEPATRKLLDFLGLDWNDHCLAPHTNRYAVETASQWQVRQPIYRHSLENWRHYEQYLGPLKDALGPQDAVVS